MTMELTLLYRGPLRSCDYGCPYCPFAKEQDPPGRREADRRALERFVGWVAARGVPTRVFFTPRGEALIHRRYQQALVDLSRLEHVSKVAIQTNLSAPLDGWLERCDPARLGIWATYHPAWTRRERFLEKCLELHRREISFSVGVVGLREHLEAIEGLRAELPEEVYLWVNAFKRQPGYYRPEEIQRIQAIDPLFHLNLHPHESRGRLCRTGHTVVSVDGEGTVRRCFFVDEKNEPPLGNIYSDPAGALERALGPRPCSVASCRCHLGYVHLEHLGLADLFGAGLLERVPARWPTAPAPRRRS
jgi:MoaA/NifB/PqqE/SkfB family radical SAM enzyme